MKIVFSLLVGMFSLVSVASIHPVSAKTTATPSPEVANIYVVTRVVDGDTLKVNINGKTETVRLLGIDAPESVDPRRPVQCFGKAASDKLKTFVSGKYVKLVADSTQGNRDVYKRLLRYVYLTNAEATFVNGEMVKQGYAFSYKQYPTKMLAKFNGFEIYAREHNLGLWGSCPVSTSKSPTPTKTVRTTYIPATPTPAPEVQQPESTSGGDKDCGDFSSHAEAQAFFLAQGGPGSDPHKLDGDHDGEACEKLP
ncbi:MAG: hypothetical protein RI947_1616 [Candidatus Parcubacteria bacterium]|jgi:micrococcal nuclease